MEAQTSYQNIKSEQQQENKNIKYQKEDLCISLSMANISSQAESKKINKIQPYAHLRSAPDTKQLRSDQYTAFLTLRLCVLGHMFSSFQSLFFHGLRCESAPRRYVHRFAECRKASGTLVLISPTPLHPAKHTDSCTAHTVSPEWR